MENLAILDGRGRNRMRRKIHGPTTNRKVGQHGRCNEGNVKRWIIALQCIEGKSKVHDSLCCALWCLSCQMLARAECNMVVGGG